MSRHYFTHSFAIDSGGDTSNLPADQDQAIVVEGVFLSVFPTSAPVDPATFIVQGLRGVHGTTGVPGGDASFFYTQSSTEVVNTYFPVHGRTDAGEEVRFTLSVSGGSSQATAQVTIWGYYTDE